MTYVSATPKDKGGLFGDVDEQLKQLMSKGLGKEEFIEAVKKVSSPFLTHNLFFQFTVR